MAKATVPDGLAIKEIKCIICGSTVSKRKSLKYKDGRACRDHEEVVNMIAEQKAKAKELFTSANIQKAMDSFNVISLTAAIRVTNYVHGIPMVILLSRVPHRLKYKVQQELEKRGPMTTTEMVDSLLMYGALMKRTNENQKEDQPKEQKTSTETIV